MIEAAGMKAGNSTGEPDGLSAFYVGLGGLVWRR